MRRVLLCVLALAVGVGAPSAAAVAKSGGGSKPAHAKKKAKKKKPKRKAASSQTGGAKGDKGDKGDPGVKGDKGDPGSTVVDRTRLAAPTSTGDGSEDDATVPLTGSSWVAAPDEADDWAGMVTVTLPSACDEPDDPTSGLPFVGGYSEPPGMSVGIKLDDGDYVGDAYVGWDSSKAGRAVTVPISFRTGRTLNGDTPTTHTFKATAGDWCASAGQSFTITDLRINVYGSR